jgi:ABC-type uncharacterized transport system substrate-binding protein
MAALVAAIASSAAVQGQPSVPTRRVGILFPAILDPSRMEAIRLGIGPVTPAGERIVLETREAGGNVDRLPALATELLHARVDVILAIAPAAVRAARAATASTPIVAMDLETDPVKSRLVNGLARPGATLPESSSTRRK